MEVKHLKIFLFLVVFISSGYSFPIFAQSTTADQYKKAENLFENEEYFEAITEFKRLIFFDTGRQYEFEADYKIALCYKMGGKFDDAIYYFIKAEKCAPAGKEKIEVQFQIIRCNILRKTTGRALELLNYLEKEGKESLKIDEISYWRGWAYMFADDFEKASEQFGLINGEHELKKICDQVKRDKYSVTFAKVISYILPGAGQFYSGEIVSGLLSLGWNALFGYLTINSFIDNRIFDGILIGDLLFLRFYSGNVQNAEKFAIEKNLEITNKALKYIQNNYRGIKP